MTEISKKTVNVKGWQLLAIGMIMILGADFIGGGRAGGSIVAIGGFIIVLLSIPAFIRESKAKKDTK